MRSTSINRYRGNDIMKLELPQKIKVLNGSQLKLIAIISMMIDHFAAAVLMNAIIMPHVPISRESVYFQIYQVYKIMRAIGRTAFPIFCFFLVEGFRYTHDRKKYALRMLLFALLSELPFDLAFEEQLFYWGHQNVFWTLLLGIVMMSVWEWIGDRTIRPIWLRGILQFLSLGCIAVLAYAMKTDYDARGILLIFVFYLLRFDRVKQIAAGALAIFWEWPAVLPAFPLLCLYNGQRGKGYKYFFYLFYPLHLILFFLLARLLYNCI